MFGNQGTFVVIGPSARELRELRLLEQRLGVEIEAYGELKRDTSGVDPNALIDGAVQAYRGRDIAGVIGSDDLGSFVASVVAKKLGLSGPSPEAVFNTQHKFLSRQTQRKHAPAENVPEFRLVPLESDTMPMPAPFFLKPVKSHLSMLSFRIDSEAAFRRAMNEARDELDRITNAYEQIRTEQLEQATAAISCNNMLAESLIEGDQVTVEGFVHGGKVTVIGVVDSVMYPGTQSFKQFDYPSKAPKSVQQRMTELAEMVARGAGLDNTMFNVEMSYDQRTDRLEVIELNSRMSSQFADLFEKVDGVNTYEVTLALASGEEPRFTHGGGEFTCASSFVLRTFEDQEVRSVPRAEDVASLKEQMPDARIEILTRAGARLSEHSQDPASFRYAIINLGGRGEEDLEQRRRAAVSALSFQFEPIGSAP
jgi:hypothetical protein